MNCLFTRRCNDVRHDRDKKGLKQVNSFFTAGLKAFAVVDRITFSRLLSLIFLPIRKLPTRQTTVKITLHLLRAANFVSFSYSLTQLHRSEFDILLPTRISLLGIFLPSSIQLNLSHIWQLFDVPSCFYSSALCHALLLDNDRFFPFIFLWKIICRRYFEEKWIIISENLLHLYELEMRMMSV